MARELPVEEREVIEAAAKALYENWMRPSNLGIRTRIPFSGAIAENFRNEARIVANALATREEQPRDPCVEHKEGRDCPVHGPARGVGELPGDGQRSEEMAERMAVIEKLAGFLADPRDDRECDCAGEGIDYEGDEWDLCECVLKKIGAMRDTEPGDGQRPVVRGRAWTVIEEPDLKLRSWREGDSIDAAFVVHDDDRCHYMRAREAQRLDEAMECLSNSPDYHGGGVMRVRDTEREHE